MKHLINFRGAQYPLLLFFPKGWKRKSLAFTNTILAATAAFLLLLIPSITWGQGSDTCQKILSSDGVGLDQRFGKAVAIKGDDAIAGAHRDDDNGTASGAAYVFTNVGGTWTEQDKLVALDGDADDQFGSAVDISGDYAIVGAPYDDKPAGFASGSAYIFFRSGGSWSQQQKLVSSDIAKADFFGYSVAICDSYAVVGALGDDDNGAASGAVYVFKRAGAVWTEVAKLTASDGAANDYFGFDVDIDMECDDIIAGAHRNDDGGSNSGSAYIFHRTGSTWTEQQILTASDASAMDSFGYSVAIIQDYAVIGAPGNDDNGSNSGSAYIFSRSGSTWTEDDKLLASDGAADDWLGWSVGITPGLAIAGAWGHDDKGSMSGSAYVYQQAGAIWAEVMEFLPDDLEAFDHFAFEVGISDNYIIGGAKGDDDNGSFAGAAYICSIFELQPKFTLYADDAASFDRLGFSSDIKGDYAIAGAPNHDETAANAGAAYIYHLAANVWSQQTELLASDGAMDDNFGWSSGISENYAIVGAPNDVDGGFATGSAYIFERSGSVWTETMKLTAPTPTSGDYFGFSVAISDSYAVVGALGEDDFGAQSGAAYVYYNSAGTWTLVATLYASDADNNDYFGFSVDIDGEGNDIIVGAPRNNDAGTHSGSAYVFSGSMASWTQIDKLTASDADASDSFGFSVAIAESYAIVGAPGESAGGTSAGAAYVFNRSGGSWSEQQKLTASDAEAGDEFGYDVGIDTMWAAVGAPYEDEGAGDAGAVYAYMRTGATWSEEFKQLAPDPDINDLTGFSVDVFDEYAIFGIRNDDEKAPDAGAVCIIHMPSVAALSPLLIPEPPVKPIEEGLAGEIGSAKNRASGNGHEAEGTISINTPYPNPTSGLINFDLELQEDGDVRVDVVNLRGQVVMSKTLNALDGITTQTLDLNGQLPGVYMVRFMTKNQMITYRVAVQR